MAILISTGEEYVLTPTPLMVLSRRSVIMKFFTTTLMSPRPQLRSNLQCFYFELVIMVLPLAPKNRTLGWCQSRHSGELHQPCDGGTSISTQQMCPPSNSQGEGERKGMGCRAGMSQVEWWVSHGRWNKVPVVPAAWPH